MSYSVRLSDEAGRKIAGWGLSASVIRELLKGLDRLGQEPFRQLVRIGPPDDCLQFDLVIFDDEELPRDHLFVFTVRYATDEETLYLIDCDLLSLDRPD